MVWQWTQKLPLVIVVSLGLVSLATTELRMDGPSFVEYGEMIKLTCNATGDLPSDIDWFKDGSKLTPYNHGMVITKHLTLMARSFESELLIDRSSYEDAGMYLCRTTDPMQIASLKVMVLNASPKGLTPGFTDEPVVDYTEMVSGCITTHTPFMLSVIVPVLLQLIL